MDVIRRPDTITRADDPRSAWARQPAPPGQGRTRQPHPAYPHQRRGRWRLDHRRHRPRQSRLVRGATRHPTRCSHPRLPRALPALNGDLSQRLQHHGRTW